MVMLSVAVMHAQRRGSPASMVIATSAVRSRPESSGKSRCSQPELKYPAASDAKMRCASSVPPLMIRTWKRAGERSTDQMRRLSRAALENGTRGMTMVCRAKSRSRTCGTDMLKPWPPASVRCTSVDALI